MATTMIPSSSRSRSADIRREDNKKNGGKRETTFRDRNRKFDNDDRKKTNSSSSLRPTSRSSSRTKGAKIGRQSTSSRSTSSRSTSSRSTSSRSTSSRSTSSRSTSSRSTESKSTESKRTRSKSTSSRSNGDKRSLRSFSGSYTSESSSRSRSQTPVDTLRGKKRPISSSPSSVERSDDERASPIQPVVPTVFPKPVFYTEDSSDPDDMRMDRIFYTELFIVSKQDLRFRDRKSDMTSVLPLALDNCASNLRVHLFDFLSLVDFSAKYSAMGIYRDHILVENDVQKWCLLIEIRTVTKHRRILPSLRRACKKILDDGTIVLPKMFGSFETRYAKKDPTVDKFSSVAWT
jgi:hypothetical protein